MSGISVIMPVYNREQYIEAAVESVMKQDYEQFELIIVDDCSLDQTPLIIKELTEKYPGRILSIRHETNTGVAQARNTAIQHSQYDILMMADSDDIQYPTRMRTMYEKLLSTSADIIFNDCEMIDDQGYSLGRYKGYPIDLNTDTVLAKLLERNYFWMSLAMLRKTSSIYFDKNIPTSEDYELFLRMALEQKRFVICQDVLTYYRIHGNNLSSNGNLSLQVTRDIFKNLDVQHVYKQLADRYDSSTTMRVMASVYAWREEPEQVVRILQHQPYHMESFFTLAMAHAQTGNYYDSLATFEHIRKQQQMPNAAVLNNIGVISHQLGYTSDQAMQWIQQALQVREDYMDALNNLRILQGEVNGTLQLTARPLRTEIVHTVASDSQHK